MPEVKCNLCSKKFYVKPSHLKLGFGKYCSIACRSEANKQGKFVSCEVCGKEKWKQPRDLIRSKSGKFFCSKSCQTKWRNVKYSGPNHYLWKGGEYVYRQKMIANGFKPICSRCRIKDIRVLQVHHKDHNRKNNNFENLVWLCSNCHILVHNHSEKF